ncbi:MAG TPA: hypothetical protein VEL07_17505 [Planctomycetota bacterium]|nr:hypothetical protein [Planctomycetota bacterium]
MSPVVARCLRGCLALIALLVSAWGNLRAAVEQPIDDRADGPAVTDVVASVAASCDAAPVIASHAPTPALVGEVDGTVALPRPSDVVRPAPGPRRGSAGGPRAP